MVPNDPERHRWIQFEKWTMTDALSVRGKIIKKRQGSQRNLGVIGSVITYMSAYEMCLPNMRLRVPSLPIN